MYTIMGDSIIIDGFLWTPLDTCHALLTVWTKYNLFVMYGNILVWADIDTGMTIDTFFAYSI